MSITISLLTHLTTTTSKRDLLVKEGKLIKLCSERAEM